MSKVIFYVTPFIHTPYSMPFFMIYREMKQYLFDAFLLLCWGHEEPAQAMVDQLLADTEEGNAHISVHILNLGAVFYRLCRLPVRKEQMRLL